MSQSIGQRRMGGQPIYILSEDSSRTQGRDAQSSNIAAGKAISESVRTTLGPRGMDKMLVSSSGDVVITNDGATILDNMDIEHPAAQMIVEVAEAQEDEVGDGTTTASVLAGELLRQAEELLAQDVHATTIVEGYHEAQRLALEAIDGQTVDSDLDDETLRSVADSSMTGKGTGGIESDRLAELVVRAIRHVQGDSGVERDDVHVHTQTGGSSAGTELVEGIIIDAEPVHDNMPQSVEDASIAVIDAELGLRESSIDTEFSITSVDQMTAALESEEQELRTIANQLIEANIDVAFVTDSIEDRVAAYLADHGILAFDDVGDDDARAIARATGATRSGRVDDFEEGDFGHADRIRVENYGDDELAFVEGGEAAEAVTMLVRGGTEHVVDELERAVNDALDVVTAALDEGGVVPGAGATEIAIADAVRQAATGIEGRQQLAVEAFAAAVDVLPRTLAENAGMDPIDALVDLRAAYESEGRAGLIVAGESGHVGNPTEEGILDPAAVKRDAIESATEAATMIVRIDDVIAAS